jgi:murein DD-endopeptidase MepM/ murein hydrolase activator NlpD
MRRNLLVLAEKVDSLKTSSEGKDALLLNIKQVMNGNVTSSASKPRDNSKPDISKVTLTPSEQEAKFRDKVEEQDRYNLSNAISDSYMSEISNYYFFTPLKGKVTTSFNPALKHYGIDVVAPKNEAVKSILDGTVIFSSFSAEDGNVIQIQHDNNLITIYKHCSALLKKTGDRVKLGDAIGIVGNSGENSRGPHLHFELWLNGAAINPKDFVVF